VRSCSGISCHGSFTDRARRPYDPQANASRANALSTASPFFTYLDTVSDETVRNPFAAVRRPVIDPDYSATEALTEEETVRLLLAARDHHQPAAYRPRAYALLLMIYTVCLRMDSVLAADVEDLGHHVVNARIKGGARKKKAISPHTWQALQDYLDGRTAVHHRPRRPAGPLPRVPTRTARQQPGLRPGRCWSTAWTPRRMRGTERVPLRAAGGTEQRQSHRADSLITFSCAAPRSRGPSILIAYVGMRSETLTSPGSRQHDLPINFCTLSLRAPGVQLPVLTATGVVLLTEPSSLISRNP